MILSKHSTTRAAQRGVRPSLLDTILAHADVDGPIGSNCRLIRVSKRRARELNLDDRLGRYALIWSESSAQIVTVMPLHDGRAGRRYRRIH